MEAYRKYNLTNVRKAITLYDELNEDKNASKWMSGKDLNGGLIGGISAVYYLIDTELGAGDKSYGLTVYLQNYLKNSTPKSLMEDTAGVSQSVLIARRIVGKCNALIENGILKKRNGEPLKQPIGEDVLVKAGLGDPSKVKEIAVEVDEEES